MLGDPRSGRKLWEAVDREIGTPGENRGQVVAHGDFNLRQLSTTERIAATLGPALQTADVFNPYFGPASETAKAQNNNVFRVFRYTEKGVATSADRDLNTDTLSE